MLVVDNQQMRLLANTLLFAFSVLLNQLLLLTLVFTSLIFIIVCVSKGCALFLGAAFLDIFNAIKIILSPLSTSFTKTRIPNTSQNTTT